MYVRSIEDVAAAALESTALAAASLAAASLCGNERSHDGVPWFWSDQHDLKLQIAGLSQGHDNVAIRGDMDERSFAAFYLLCLFINWWYYLGPKAEYQNP